MEEGPDQIWVILVYKTKDTLFLILHQATRRVLARCVGGMCAEVSCVKVWRGRVEGRGVLRQRHDSTKPRRIALCCVGEVLCVCCRRSLSSEGRVHGSEDTVFSSSTFLQRSVTTTTPLYRYYNTPPPPFTFPTPFPCTPMRRFEHDPLQGYAADALLNGPPEESEPQAYDTYNTKECTHREVEAPTRQFRWTKNLNDLKPESQTEKDRNDVEAYYNNVFFCAAGNSKTWVLDALLENKVRRVIAERLPGKGLDVTYMTEWYENRSKGMQASWSKASKKAEKSTTEQVRYDAEAYNDTLFDTLCRAFRTKHSPISEPTAMSILQKYFDTINSTVTDREPKVFDALLDATQAMNIEVPLDFLLMLSSEETMRLCEDEGKANTNTAKTQRKTEKGSADVAVKEQQSMRRRLCDEFRMRCFDKSTAVEMLKQFVIGMEEQESFSDADLWNCSEQRFNIEAANKMRDTVYGMIAKILHTQQRWTEDLTKYLKARKKLKNLESSVYSKNPDIGSPERMRNNNPHHISLSQRLTSSRRSSRRRRKGKLPYGQHAPSKHSGKK